MKTVTLKARPSSLHYRNEKQGKNRGGKNLTEAMIKKIFFPSLGAFSENKHRQLKSRTERPKKEAFWVANTFRLAIFFSVLVENREDI